MAPASMIARRTSAAASPAAARGAFAGERLQALEPLARRADRERGRRGRRHAAQRVHGRGSEAKLAAGQRAREPRDAGFALAWGELAEAAGQQLDLLRTAASGRGLVGDGDERVQVHRQSVVAADTPAVLRSAPVSGRHGGMIWNFWPSSAITAFKKNTVASSLRGAPMAVIFLPTARMSGVSPMRTSMFAGAVSVNSTICVVPSGFLIVNVIAAWGLRNFTFSTTPLNSMFCVMSHTANEWWAVAGKAANASVAQSRVANDFVMASFPVR